MRSTRFTWTNRRITLPKNKVAVTRNIEKDILINRTWQDSFIGDSYELFWFNTVSHELWHKFKQFSVFTEGVPKIFEGEIEAAAAEIGDEMENLIRSNKGFKNLFDDRWEEAERIGLADYIGVRFKLAKQNEKLNNQRKLLDIYEGQLKKVEDGTFVTEDKKSALKDLNSKIKNLKDKIGKSKEEIKQSEKKKEDLEKKHSKIINTSYL